LDLATALGLVAGVLVVSALAAGLIERAPLSFPMLFLGLGFVVGDRGLELISVGLDSRLLEVVAIVTLSLVLFLDAVNLELSELRRDWLTPFLVIGPATLLVAGLLAGAGCCCWGCPWSWRPCWEPSWPPPTPWSCATCSGTRASPARSGGP
jgi:sodium/hydrogen antiporter